MIQFLESIIIVKLVIWTTFIEAETMQQNNCIQRLNHVNGKKNRFKRKSVSPFELIQLKEFSLDWKIEC